MCNFQNGIDIHCHVLPGIDDGARDLAEAVAMCRLAVEDGCKALVATPHLRHERWWNDDRRRLETLQQAVQDQVGEDLQVLLGGEIAVNTESYAELWELPDGRLPTLAGSRYVLLEFDRHGLGPDPLELIHELRIAGWFPVIAHPERISWLAGNLPLLHECVASGAHLQITAMSLTGDLGQRLAALSASLIEHDLVTFIASDAHSVGLRPPGLRRAFRAVEERWGREKAQFLLIDHPQHLLDDEPLEILR